jgi:hypothetical protein
MERCMARCSWCSENMGTLDRISPGITGRLAKGDSRAGPRCFERASRTFRCRQFWHLRSQHSQHATVISPFSHMRHARPWSGRGGAQQAFREQFRLAEAEVTPAPQNSCRRRRQPLLLPGASGRCWVGVQVDDLVRTRRQNGLGHGFHNKNVLPTWTDTVTVSCHEALPTSAR